MKYEFEWEKPEFDWTAPTNEGRFVWQIPPHVATIVTLANEQDLLELVESYQRNLVDDDVEILVLLYYILGTKYSWLESLERAESTAVEWLADHYPGGPEYSHRLELATFMSHVMAKYSQYHDRCSTEGSQSDEADRLWEEAKWYLEQLDNEPNVSILKDAVHLLEQASEFATPGHPMLRLILQDLHREGDRYAHYTGETSYVDTLINSLRSSGEQFGGGDLDRAWYLHTLGTAHANRYQSQYAEDDIMEAVRLAKLAVDHKPRDHRYTAMVLSLITWRFLGYKTTPREEDIDEIADMSNAAIEECPAADSKRPNLLMIMAHILLEQYRSNSDLESLDAAASYGEAAIESVDDHDDLLNFQHDFANHILLEQYHATGEVQHLDRAINILEQLAGGIPSDGQLFNASRLGKASLLYVRAERNGNDDDLTSATRILENILCDLDVEDQQRAPIQNMLAGCYGTIWKRRGDPTLLDLAIEIAAEAVDHLGSKHAERSTVLNTLGWWLGQRFQLIGAMEDLEKGIQVSEEAVELAPKTPYSALTRSLFMFGLGNLLVKRWRRLKDTKDINEAIRLAEEGLQFTPHTSSERPAHLAYLCDWLFLRAYHTQNKDDNAKARDVAIEAVMTTRHDAPEQAYLWSVVVRQATSDPHLTDFAILIAQDALEETPPDHPERAIRLQTLGILHEAVYRRSLQESHLEKALSHLSQSYNCRNGNALIRVQSSIKQARLLVDFEPRRWKDASDILIEAVSMIQITNPQTLSNTDKQHILAELSGLGCMAAAVHLGAGLSPYQALDQLELARGVIASHLMDMHTDLSFLKEKSPALAAQFLRLRDELEATEPCMNSGSTYVSIASRRSKAQAEMKNIMFEIREKILNAGGPSVFMGSPSQHQLRNAAVSGPIIVVNISTYRSDAFLLLDKENLLQVVPLRITEDDVVREAQEPMPRWLQWLWDYIAEPILMALDFTQSPQDSVWPHVWWILTGPLANAPIHAAGYHGDGSTKTVLDRVISSYSPSVKGLIHRREASQRVEHQLPETKDTTKANIQNNCAVLVAMEKTPKGPGSRLAQLKSAEKEIDILRKMCPKLGLTPVEPARLRNAVLSLVKTCRVFHFAGHGISDAKEPSQGSLLLEDWATSRLTVAHFQSLNLGSGKFPPFLAYLSACRTGSNAASKLLDESINLVNACYLAGFAHVIGTLWTVKDRTCLDVAGRVYKSLRDEGLTDKAVSEGLHWGVRDLRDRAFKNHSNDKQGSGSKAFRSSGLDDPSTWQSSEEDSGESDGQLEGRDVADDDGFVAKKFFWVPYVHVGI